jgi:PAS domain S-box-containing protein
MTSRRGDVALQTVGECDLGLISTLQAWFGPILGVRAYTTWKNRLALQLSAGTVVAAAIGIVVAYLADSDLLAILGVITMVLAVASQAVLRRELAERLAESRKQWFSSSPRGLAELDGDLCIVEGNGRLAFLLGTDQSDLEGSLLTRFFPQEDSAGIVAQFNTLVSGSASTIESDSLGVRSDGSRIWLHWRATEVRRDDGDFSYFVITFEDTTQKHTAEAAALANLAELEKLNRLKSEFTSMVSHEFRTALTGIQGMSELINTGNMGPPEIHEYSGYIFKEAERINRLISDMLDLDRLEAGKLTMHMTPVDLNSLIEDLVDRTRAVSTTHTFTTDLAPGELMVTGDSDRLVQVLTNLVSNAVKYSPAGGEVMISSSVSGELAEVAVRDHGAGIPPEFLEHLFERYERYDKNPAVIIGTGLGLAITRQIVEMHGGRIWAEQGEGGGSVFRLTIPSHAHPAPGQRATAGAAS